MKIQLMNMKKISIIAVIALSVILGSCSKDEDTLQQIVVGEKTENGIFTVFDPIIINRNYHTSASTNKTINFLGNDCLVISNYFTVSLGDNMEHNSQYISTLNNCSLKVNENELGEYKLGAIVDIDDNFQSNSYSIINLESDSYLVFKFETDKEYIGWIKIVKSGYDVIVNDYCLYEIK